MHARTSRELTQAAKAQANVCGEMPVPSLSLASFAVTASNTPAAMSLCNCVAKQATASKQAGTARRRQAAKPSALISSWWWWWRWW